jgi:hypothetical protein
MSAKTMSANDMMKAKQSELVEPKIRIYDGAASHNVDNLEVFVRVVTSGTPEWEELGFQKICDKLPTYVPAYDKFRAAYNKSNNNSINSVTAENAGKRLTFMK